MTLHLIAPGLFGPMPALAQPGDISRFHNLERLLARADSSAAMAGYAETLFELFGIPFVEGEGLPTAALCYLADAGEAYPQFLFQADPVFLKPDQDRLLLFDTSAISLTMDEARQFADAFNRHFAEDGLQLLVPHKKRWYLAVSPVPVLHTHGLDKVIGRNIDFFLPTGKDAGFWRRVLNETQMLFHGLEVNYRREMAGEVPISGLWLSGGGMLPASPTQSYSLLDGQCQLYSGLQMHGSLPATDGMVLEHASGRAVFNADAQAWVKAVQALNDSLPNYLSQTDELVIHACNGTRYTWKPALKRRWWRRSRPLVDMLEQNPDIPRV